MRHRLLSGLVWVLLALAVAAVLGDARAQGSFDSTGGTTVTVDGSTVTIGVTIDLLLGGVGETELPEGAQQGADELAAEIADYWNQGLARLASDCLSLRLSVTINALPMSEHRLLVKRERSLAACERERVSGCLLLHVSETVGPLLIGLGGLVLSAQTLRAQAQ